MLKLAQRLAVIANEQHTWRIYAVGGFVRDMVIGIESKDLDLEVFGPKSVDELEQFLAQFGDVKTVGKSFGIFKLRIDGIDLDVSLPRTESKAGNGHKGFMVIPDGLLTPLEAAKRRDFTFNALMYDCLSNEIVDPFNGVQDLKQHRLQHTSEFFADDPLRVLRGMQFCGRFDLIANNETVQMSRSLLNEFDTLSTERLWLEFEKWATKSIKPSRGLVFLHRSGWLKKFPELYNLIGLEQDTDWHPEGSVWQHTKFTVDVAVKIAKRECLNTRQTLVLVLAALLHDVGKVSTTEFCEDGRIRSKGHDTIGANLAANFLTSIGAPLDVIHDVCILIKEHMVHVGVQNADKRLARRLVNRLDGVSVKMLAYLIESDHSGRPPHKAGLPEQMEEIVSIANELKIENKVEPLLLGRHLIELGMHPGKEFGIILNAAFEAQLDGVFEDVESGKLWLKEYIK